MANTILTTTSVLRKSLMILHQKLNFVGNIHRGYDSKFAVDGAKIGDTLVIRLPNEYPTGTGATITDADTTEQSTSITVSTQRWVAPSFLSSELTLSLDDFSERVAEPAMTRLAAQVEADALTMSKDVYRQVGTPGTVPSTFLTYATAGAVLTDELAPTSKRCFHLKPVDMATIVDALKGLFQSSENIASQYREGVMGEAIGGKWYQNTHMIRHTNGNKVASVTISGASQTGATLTLGSLTASDTFKKGQVFTIAGVNRVHPETKVDMGELQQFVVTADATAAGATLAIGIAPSIIVSGATQTVTGSPANGAAVVFAGTANLTYGLDLHFYKDAFALATADLVMPKGVDMSGREVMDDISLRMVRQYEVGSDKLRTRFDVLYGFKTIRRQLACRIASN